VWLLGRARRPEDSEHNLSDAPARHKAYRAANRDRLRVYRREYYWQHREQELAYGRARYQRLKDEEMCVHCGRMLAITDTRCFDCANNQQFYDSVRIR
jgi:hypothetical protein